MDWKTELWRFVAYVASLLAVISFALAPLRKRIEILEAEQRTSPKRTVYDCELMMGKCPVQVRITLFGEVLNEIKGELKEIRRDVKDHIKYHMISDKGD